MVFRSKVYIPTPHPINPFPDITKYDPIDYHEVSLDPLAKINHNKGFLIKDEPFFFNNLLIQPMICLELTIWNCKIKKSLGEIIEWTLLKPGGEQDFALCRRNLPRRTVLSFHLFWGKSRLCRSSRNSSKNKTKQLLRKIQTWKHYFFFYFPLKEFSEIHKKTLLL